MEWVRTLKLFVSVVHSGSLSAAGRNLGYSPASVSRHMTALETQLDAKLLNRSSRKLALTEAGETYFRQVEQILQHLAEANDSVAQMQAAPRGVLRVHSRMLVGEHVIVPALPAFLARYPDITVDLALSNGVVALVEQNFDVDIRIGKLVDSSLIARKLTSSARIVCAAPSYIASHPPVLQPGDLAAHNCLTYRVNLGQTVWRFRSDDDRVLEVPVDGSFRTDNGQSLLRMIKAGLGVGLMPDWSIQDELASGELVRLFPEHQVSHIEFENGVYAVYQKTRQATTKVKLFVDHLVSVFRERLA
ncbi:LysR family transcriptional regulator [Pseudorhodoplanes sinuspersici]|uniref:LysR family transcriptional regulator n=1 Tax=Pseudorhodoplanes sinuspersici TaxID=1235591 RepID=UPI000FF4B900|nr:LysR family transcriptional regulator [Pseudorhodoplanes sinuspersici]RKE70762.1 LysR family transcriptional regulator [Pseudorhodoplanes sinuspersici]